MLFDKTAPRKKVKFEYDKVFFYLKHKKDEFFQPDDPGIETRYKMMLQQFDDEIKFQKKFYQQVL